MIITDFDDLIAERMRVEHRALAARWFDRLLDLLPVDAREVFPTESLLDHVPSLILEISAYLADPEEGAIAANTAILDKARELGALRSFPARLAAPGAARVPAAQRRPGHVRRGGNRAARDAPPCGDCDRLCDLPAASTRRTCSRKRPSSRSSRSTRRRSPNSRERLEQFTRMAAHEWRQPLGALQFGVSLLSVAELDPARTQRTLDIARAGA